MKKSTASLHKYSGEGLVFNIQRFSLHDGPGIRTLVFLKGCPLRCAWCSNPEGLSRKNQVLYHAHKCKRCAACLQCPEQAVYEQDGLFRTDQHKCTGCGKCALWCAYGARTMTNKVMSAQQVIDACQRDAIFYSTSEGGLTLGGGDPMMQPEFARDILTLAKRCGLNTAIETSAFACEEDFFSIIALCDTVHIDIKAADDATHKKIAKVSNACILHNIRSYDARTHNSDGRVIFRIPLIPSYNAQADTVKKIGEFIRSLQGVYKVEILPFHNFGESKYQQLCIPYAFEDGDNMKQAEAVPYREMLADMGLSVTINTH